MPTEGGWRRFLLAVAVLFAAACSESAGDGAYETSAVEIGDVRDIVPATGTLLAAGMAEVRAPRAGVVAAVYVKEGDTVRAGQVLATLSAPTRAPAGCLLYTSPSPRDLSTSRMPSSA